MIFPSSFSTLEAVSLHRPFSSCYFCHITWSSPALGICQTWLSCIMENKGFGFCCLCFCAPGVLKENSGPVLNTYVCKLETDRRADYLGRFSSVWFQIFLPNNSINMKMCYFVFDATSTSKISRPQQRRGLWEIQDHESQNTVIVIVIMCL